MFVQTRQKKIITSLTSPSNKDSASTDDMKDNDIMNKVKHGASSALNKVRRKQ